MQSLTLHNFKSYSTHTIPSLNPHINIIIGGNGQGKSNLFKAISFVLSDRLQLNRTEYNGCLHRGVGGARGTGMGEREGERDKDGDIEVQVVMDLGVEGGRNGSGQVVKLSKVWKSNLVQQLYLDSKFTTKKQYQNLIQSLRLSYTNPYNIIQQGKITQITLMDEFQLYSLLQQATGLKKFLKRKEDALTFLSKLQSQKSQSLQLLHDLDLKLQSLQSRRQQFQYFSIEQKTKKYRLRKQLTQLLQNTRHNLERVRSEYEAVCEGYGKVIGRRREVQGGIEEEKVMIGVGRKKLGVIGQSEGLGGDEERMGTQEVRELEVRQKQLHKMLKQNAKKMKEKDGIVNYFKKQFSHIQKQYQQTKLLKQLTKPPETIQKLLQAYQTELQTQQSHLKSLQSQSHTLESQLRSLSTTLTSPATLQLQSRHENHQSTLQQLKHTLQATQKQLNILNYQKNLQVVECGSLKELMDQAEAKLRRAMPGLDYRLMDVLRGEGVRGVYGFFIEFVRIEEEVRGVFEAVGLRRLCGILVEDQAACQAVIQCNRRIKGREIVIIQLDYIRNQPSQSTPTPKTPQTHKLSSQKFITPTPNPHSPPQSDLQKLIKSTFDKYILVKDYQTGLKISKQYHLTCVTRDLEIVYAEGYHCRLGEQRVGWESAVGLFQRFGERRRGYRDRVGELGRLEGRIGELVGVERKVLGELDGLERQTGKISSNIAQINMKTKLHDTYTKNLTQLTKKIQQQTKSIQQKQQSITSLTTSLTTSKSSKSQPTPQQTQKIEQAYMTGRKQLTRMLTEIFQLEERMQKLVQEKEGIDERVIGLKNGVGMGVGMDTGMGVGVGDIGKIEKQIERDVKERQKRIKELEKEFQALGVSQRQLQLQKGCIEVKLITYRSQQQDILSKLSQIGQPPQNLPQLEQLSNSISLSHTLSHKKPHFSTKDKLLFAKFASILESFDSHKKAFKQLQEAEERIRKLMDLYERESEEYMAGMVEKFQREFVDVFGRLVQGGSVEVRGKKVSEKVKDTVRYRNCLIVRVAFSDNTSQSLKKWTQFSGGQKTIIALSILLSLQRCQPSPFYILDEIDSALDPTYIQKIVELLTHETQQHAGGIRSQYFISTFKEQMLGFPEEICSCYLVGMQGRVSTVERVGVGRGREVLGSVRG